MDLTLNRYSNITYLKNPCFFAFLLFFSIGKENVIFFLNIQGDGENLNRKKCILEKNIFL